MITEKTAPQDQIGLDLAAIQLLATEVIQTRLRQNEAMKQWPLAYINALLDAMADANYVSLSDIPEELGNVVPWLEPDICLNLVGAYFDSRPRSQ